MMFNSYGQGIKIPAPSPGQTIKQDFSLSAIEVVYSSFSHSHTSK